MKITRRIVSFVVAALATSAALVSSARAGADDVVSYKFHKPPVNALGVSSLEDLRGKPVLIDFWGTR